MPERTKMLRDFTIIVSYGDHQTIGAFAFDPDDIYDGSLAPEVRALARETLRKAGLRESAELA